MLDVELDVEGWLEVGSTSRVNEIMTISTTAPWNHSEVDKSKHSEVNEAPKQILHTPSVVARR